MLLPVEAQDLTLTVFQLTLAQLYLVHLYVRVYIHFSQATVSVVKLQMYFQFLLLPC